MKLKYLTLRLRAFLYFYDKLMYWIYKDDGLFKTDEERKFRYDIDENLTKIRNKIVDYFKPKLADAYVKEDVMK